MCLKTIKINIDYSIYFIVKIRTIAHDTSMIINIHFISLEKITGFLINITRFKSYQIKLKAIN